MPTTPTVSIQSITPKLAAEWLSRNTHNRGIKPRVVDKYAAAMSRGEWVLNGEAIKFNGIELLDGQHRLAAVVASGVTIDSLVVEGLPASVQDSLDHHVPRTLGDVLSLHGEKNASDLASALTNLFRIEMDKESSTLFPSAPQALDLLERHPAVRESVHIGGQVNTRLGTPRGMTAAMHYVFASIDAEDAEAFFARLIDGQGLKAGSPILLYREWCLRELRNVGIAGRRPAVSRVQAFMVKAWNGWRRNQDMKILKWNVGGANPEPFPKAL